MCMKNNAFRTRTAGLLLTFFYLFGCDFILLLINHCYFPCFIKTVTLGKVVFIMESYKSLVFQLMNGRCARKSIN